MKVFYDEKEGIVMTTIRMIAGFEEPTNCSIRVEGEPIYPLQVMASIKSGIAPDVNALSSLILIGTVIFVILMQGNLFKKKMDLIRRTCFRMFVPKMVQVKQKM